jgi:16S rRNA G527 N7-methylase RsmG
LTNLETVHAHADHWRTDRTFDAVCTRAVATIAKCMSFAPNLTAPQGWFVAFKTPASDEQERDEANRLAGNRRMIREPSFDYELGGLEERLPRRLVVYRRDA